jgi:hypothetical protein
MNPTENNSGASVNSSGQIPAAAHTGIIEKPQSTQDASSSGNKNFANLPSWVKPLYIVIIVCFLIIAAVAIWLFAFNKGEKLGFSLGSAPTPTATAKKQTTISGNILFQGYASDEAYLVIAEKTPGQDSFKSVITGIVPQTGAIPWTWKEATAGTNYEIQAQLKIRGNTIQSSTSNVISAPGSNVNLVIVSNQAPPTPAPAQVSGTVNINGYIPQGAMVNITADTTSGPGGQTTLPQITATDDSSWSWSNASSGTTYDITAQLVDVNGNPLALPVSANITAPSSGLQFNINSTAQPPAPTVTGLSGNITINGSIPTNAYITIGTRVSGTSSFNQVGSNISATNNVAWSWQQAQAGTSYDVQAYLWSNNQPYAQSPITTIVAPANNVSLTINAQQSTSAPGSNTMNVSCGGQQSGAYQATINYNTQSNLSNASSYNIIVTLASQGSQVLNTTVSPPNPTQSQNLTTTYIFTSGATYYAQYAYAIGGSSNYSPLSPAIQFSCR